MYKNIYGRINESLLSYQSNLQNLMTKFKIINKVNLQFFIGFLLIIILSFTNLDINLKSLIFLTILIYFYFVQENSEFRFLLESLNYRYFYLSILFFTLIIYQNYYLNFEIISIDVPSYLVASRTESFFELPFLTQWESKGPIFIYLYRILLILSNENYLIFRLLNDVLLFIITFLIYLISFEKSKNNFRAFCSCLIFILITSHVWYVTELSEIYCLVFILFQYLILSKYSITKFSIFSSGILISISSLINQSTAIFLIGVCFFIYYFQKLKNISTYLYLFFGFITPHILFFLLYLLNDLSIIYITNYITIPFGYVGTGKFEIYELTVWLRRYFQYNQFLYFSIIGLTFISFLEFFRRKTFGIFNNLVNIIYLFSGFLIYVIAGHNYEHHLFYAIAFFSIYVSQLNFDKSIFLICMILFISSLQILNTTFEKSFNNLVNYEQTYENYPLNQLSKEIKTYFTDDDFNVLAVDHVLLLYYLEKPNISYIIHPFNNFEEYIVKALLDTQILKTNDFSHLSYYIETEPDIVICAAQTIIDGSPTKLGGDIFNCEVTDYKKNYMKINTEYFRSNPNREYYYNPYISIDLFIKNKE